MHRGFRYQQCSESAGNGMSRMRKFIEMLFKNYEKLHKMDVRHLSDAYHTTERGHICC